jgi:hypothetical protein
MKSTSKKSLLKQRPARGGKKDPPPARGSRGVKTRAKLPQTAKSKTEAAMHDRLSSLEVGSKRYTVLVCAIDFKRSWVDLAHHLTEVMRSGAFKEWGFRTFEAYAQHELFLRRDTALKLTRSYDFLSQHEPSLVEGVRGDPQAAPLPNFQSIDALAEARKNPQLSETDYRDLRDRVFGEDMTPSQVKKMVREKAPEPLTQKKEAPEDRLRKALQIAERLYGMLLEEEDVPERITQSIEEAVGGLRRMLDE